MGKLQKQLEHLLAKVGKVSHGTLPFPRPYDLIGWSSRDQVDDVFRSLGGIAPDIPLNLRRWDFEFNDVVVEFDERLHFNQYRRATLQSAIYNKLQPCPVSAYREYCVSYEEACLKAGGYGDKWSNTSCNSQFGDASPPRDFSGNGPSRWKQRAFYDFVKDLSPLLIAVSMARIAVWDLVTEAGAQRTVEDALKKPSAPTAVALAQLIEARTVRP
jgi:hypothetical protein